MSRNVDLRRAVGSGLGRLRPDRRVMMIGGGATVGLALAWTVWPRSNEAPIGTGPGEHVFGPYLKIGTDGHIAVLVPQLEMGQGIFTLIAQLVADELGADWRTVSVEPAPIAGVYQNEDMLGRDAALAAPRFAVPEPLSTIGAWRLFSVGRGAAAMITDEALILSDFELSVRESAAIARAMLRMAAADRWDADWQSCETAQGFVTLGNRRMRFGELAAAASEFDPPDYPPLRAPGTGHLFGQSASRIDLPSKIDGSFAFAGDIRLPNMVYATVRHGPIGDSVLERYDRSGADRIAGFLGAVRHERWLAAVAINGWIAQRALDAMAPIFSSTGQRADSAVIDRRLKAAMLAHDGVRVFDQGAVGEAMEGRPVLTADYSIAPALHAALETRTAVAMQDGDRMLVWAASQAPGACRAAIAEALGLHTGAVTLFVMPSGGGQGIAMDHGTAVQAALVARAMQRPVNLCWTRTEDILQDMPRPPARARMLATLSSGTTIDCWQVSIATPAVRHEWHGRFAGQRPDAAATSAAGRADAAAVDGARPPYTIPNLAIEHLPVDIALPVGRWRGNSYSITSFLTECFVDELAGVAGVDPLSFRMGMLGGSPDLAACLQSAAETGGWNGAQSGTGHGLACATIDGSHIAIMAVARPGTRGLIVERLVAVADVGQVLNPGITRQQIEGGIVFGLAQAVGATTRYRRGLARARRLRDIGLPNLAQMPDISVALVPSNREPGGIGQIGVPLVAPAIANALYTMTGERLRRLPLSTKALP